MHDTLSVKFVELFIRLTAEEVSRLVNCGTRDEGVSEARRDGTMPSDFFEEECHMPHPFSTFRYV